MFAVTIPFGLMLGWLIPIGAGADEESQIARVWEMSTLEFIPNERLGSPSYPYPMLLREVSYRRQVLIHPVPIDYWTEYTEMPIDGNGYYYGPIQTRIVYSPILLLPQAFVFRYLGTKFGLSFLTVFFSVRLATLLSYVVLVWLAVRSIPFGKWTLAILAVSPIAVYQASTVSSDAISNGIGLFFIAVCLAICRREDVRLRDLLAILLLIALLFVAKINLVPLALLPFVLLRPSDFNRRGGYALMVLGTLLLLALEVGGWSLAAYPRVRSSMLEGADPLRQLGHILDSPLQFVWLVVTDLWSNGAIYLRTWIANFGYHIWSIPFPTYLFYGFAVVASLFVPALTNEPTKRTRLGLVAVAIVSYLFIATAFYVAFNPVASQTLAGMGGRHLQTTMAFFVLAWVGLITPLRTHWSRWAVGGAVAGLLVFVGGTALSYHVMCGPQVYQPGLCYYPYYKNWAPNENLSRPINSDVELSQEVIPECSGLTEVRVWIGKSANATGSTTFTLLDSLRSSELATKTIANADLGEPGWQRLEINPDWDSKGRSYLLIIQGEQEGPGPQAGLTIRPENPSMTLWINGDQSDLDLFFQYGCLAGLERALR